MNTALFSDDKRNNAVYEVQHYLRFLSKHIIGIPTVTPDGIFGKETEDAVKAFQHIYSLPVTGEVNYTTWNLIYEIYKNVKEDKSPPNPVYVFPLEITAMKRGDEFNEIFILQAIIQKISIRFPNLPSVAVTGSFDKNTEQTVKELQNIFGYEKNGRVDRKTWNKLADLYSVFTAND